MSLHNVHTQQYSIVLAKITNTTSTNLLCPAVDTEGDDERNKNSEEEEKFEQLLSQIKQYYGLWKPIGIELGIDVTDIERDYKGNSNRLQAVILKQWPHSDNPSLKYKELLKACQSGRVFSAIGGTHIHDQGCINLPMVAHMPLLLLTYQ